MRSITLNGPWRDRICSIRKLVVRCCTLTTQMYLTEDIIVCGVTRVILCIRNSRTLLRTQSLPCKVM